MKVPELLLPAGNMRTLKTALRFGADAVYCGMKQYGLRAQAGNLTAEELAEACKLCHDKGTRLYVTLNIFAKDSDRDGMVAAAKEAKLLGADAVIVSDLGVIDAIIKNVHELDVHVSTQANCTNSASARVFSRLGAKRVVLARELSMNEIEHMAAELNGEIELEAFVHGAECMSYSGRCMLSSYLNGRSANRGACTQPCRWDYRVVEAGQPGEGLYVEEGDNGSAIFSARDLCMIDYIDRLADAGLSCLKVEGRMKNELYVATVANVYRQALNMCAEKKHPGSDCSQKWHEELEKVSHRPYDTGFYFGHPHIAGEAKPTQLAEYCGFILEADKNRALIEMKNRFFVGDVLEAVTPEGIKPFPVEEIIRNETGESVDCVKIPLDKVWVPCSNGITAGDLLRGPVRNRANT